VTTTIPSGFGLASLAFKRTGSSKTAHITFGFDCGGDATVSHAAALKVLWEGTGMPFEASNMYSQWTYTGCNTLQREDLDLFSFTFETNTVGTRTGNMLPPQTAILVKKSTSFAGKSNRGRFYVPPVFVSETAIDDSGVMDNTTLASLQAKFDDALAAMATANLNMQILHEGAGAPREVSALAVENLVATQRRRLR